MRDSQDADKPTAAPRDAYEKPTLTAYGSVAKLTQTGIGTQMDSGMNNRMMFCL